MIDIKNIFGYDIYENFDDSEYDLDLHGWGGERPWFSDVIKKNKPKVIIEIGTWKGQSAVTMAKALRDNKIDGKVICVDTWLGSTEHWDKKSNKKTRWGSLKHDHGYPTLYFQFLANVKKEELEKYIIPIPNTSWVAAKLLQKNKVKADIIYIDASHEYEPVKMDLNIYWDLLKEGGILCGDDYSKNWPGVKKAANEFAKEKGAQLKVESKSLFVIKKGG